jgi:hypothetical protein
VKDKKDNVIVFPKTNAQNYKNLKTVEDVQRNVDMMKHYHIQETILNLAPIIFNHLDIAGFGLSDDEDDDVKDGAMIIESLRSYMCKYYGEYHPFQIIAENVFIPKDDEEDAFKIVDELAVELKNPDTE